MSFLSSQGGGGGGSGVTAISAVGSAPNANGGTIAGSILNLEPANATNPGVVTIIAQTFAGIKTWVNNQIFNAEILADLSLWRKYTPVASATGAVTINWNTTAEHEITLTGNTTLTFTAPTSQTGYKKRLTLRINTGAGGFTCAFPAGVIWLRTGGTAPTITTTASKVGYLTLEYNNTDYVASYSENV